MTTDELERDGAVGDLRQRAQGLRAARPDLRARDLALALGVSEAELVAARCGDGVRRLDGPWGGLIERLPELGIVMALTRGEYAVHEKVGRYDKISLFGRMGLVLNGDIDLRLFLDHWQLGFAVQEETRSGPRQSLQFFDADGTAVHKIYLRSESEAAAYGRLVQDYLHPDQSPVASVKALAATEPDRPDGDIDRTALRQRWLALQDVHDFHAMLGDLGVGRVQAMRLVGDDLAYQVDKASLRQALEQAAVSQLPVMVFVGSPGVIQIHTGAVHTLKQMGPWFNVLDPGFNLHLREDGVAAVWVVRKPTADGIVTSLELYDSDNRQIAWLFGERHVGEPEREDWRAVIAGLSRPEMAA